MNISELNEYFQKHNYSTYERNRFDEFLSHVNFSFSVPSIHITGTNGKGSTSNYLYQIYLKQGYKVGYFQSPYLSSVLEMISINGENISSDEMITLFSKYQAEFEKFGLSSFEMQTFIAYQAFISHNLDLVIIEVGMGGFIDATNIITPLLSIITNVSLEHTLYLGRSISEIAYNKAGIIKTEVPALVGNVDETALFAIREYAKEMNSKVYSISEPFNVRLIENCIHFDYIGFKDLILNTKAEYQTNNAAIALEAVTLLKEKLPINEEAIRQGLSCVTLPCRFEFINEHLLLDGAHNPDGMEKLAKTIEKIGGNYHVIFASFKDKNIDSMLISLGMISKDVTLTTFAHPRARKEEDYFLYLGDYKFSEDYMSLIKQKMAEYPNDIILITGSLAFAGVIREKLAK